MEFTGGAIKFSDMTMLVGFDTVSVSGLRLENNKISEKLMGHFYDEA